MLEVKIRQFNFDDDQLEIIKDALFNFKMHLKSGDPCDFVDGEEDMNYDHHDVEALYELLEGE